MKATIAIVWPCPLDVEGYAAGGRTVKAPRRSCPRCGRAMIFWGGYRRFVRAQRAVPIFIRRARCRSCSTSHALIPAFLLTRRFDPVEVIGSALARAVGGAGMRPIAAQLEVPHSTARDWRRRYRARAPTLAAGFAALVVEFSGLAPRLSSDPETAGLEALAAAWEQARRRFGSSIPTPWRFAAAITGGGMLATTTSPPWAGPFRGDWMPPRPTGEGR